MTTIAPHRLWRNTRYLTWLVSDTAKGLAQSLSGFAIPLIALVVTNDPAQAGIIGGVGMVARLLTTLAGGVLADRHRRILLMLLGSLIGIVLSMAFTLLAVGDAFTFTSLLIVAVLLTARAGLFDVAGESALKEIVPDDAMGRAQAANQGRDAALQLAGGPLGGVLLGVGGWLVGLVMTVCHLIAALGAGMLERSRPASSVSVVPAPEHQAPNASGELREGFRWLLSRTDLRGVLLITTVVNLGFNAMVTTVVYALQQDGHSETVIGLIGAGIGAVMLIGAFIAPLLVARLRAGLVTVAGLACATVGAGAVALVRDPLMIVGVLAASVVLLPALNASMLGYFMVATPTALLGRANSAAAVLSMGAMPLAPLIAGFGLAWIGRESTILISAGLCALAVLLAVCNRTLRELPAEGGWAAHAARFE